MSRMPPDQKKLTIRVRIPQSALTPEEHLARLQHPVTPGVTFRRMTMLGTLTLAVVLAIASWAFRHDVEEMDGTAVEPTRLESIQDPTADVPSQIANQAVVAAGASNHEKMAPGGVAPHPATPPQQSGTENEVVHALLTESMRGGVPGAPVESSYPSHGQTRKLHFYTELKHSVGRRYTHVWEYHGKTIARIDFKSRGDTWRASSNKKLPPNMEGQWHAKLLDEHGNVITSVQFLYRSDDNSQNGHQ